MKKASVQWLESAGMDLGSINRIIQTLDRPVKCQELTPKTCIQSLTPSPAQIMAAGPASYAAASLLDLPVRTSYYCGRQLERITWRQGEGQAIWGKHL